MKKFLSMIAAVSLLAASLSACGASSTASTTAAAAAPAAEGGKEYKVAIVQQLDHASLDEIRVAIEAELEAKKGFVLDAFRRIGGLELPIDQVLASPQEDRYRNKVQFPVQRDERGHAVAGFYAGRSHRIIPCEDCLLQPAILNQIAQAVCSWMDENGVSPYDETSHTGLVRHIFLRRGTHSRQIMLCLVINGRSLPHSEAFCSTMLQRFPEIQTILLNVNTQRTNVITGLESISLYGPGYIEDSMCGVPVRLGPLSFYQVNTPSAERLYALARQYAQLKPTDRLLDLYCGMGTIGAGLCRSGRRGDHPRSGGKRPAECRPHGSSRPLFVRRRRPGRLSAGRRGSCSGCDSAGPAPQRLRCRHSGRRMHHGPPPRCDDQLQPCYRRAGCALFGRPRLPAGTAQLCGSVCTNQAR